MLELIATALLAVEPHAAATRFSTRDVPEALGSAAADRFAVALRQRGVTVTTDRDVAAVLTVERQAQLLGCAESSTSCLTELAGALGAPFLVSGHVSRIGSKVMLSIKVLQASNGSTLYTLGTELPSVEVVLEAVERAARPAADRILAAAADASPTLVTGSGPTSTTGPWLLVATGALAAGAGAALLISAELYASLLQGEPQAGLGPTQADALAARTGPTRLAGAVALGAGAALVIGGIVWRITQGSGPAVALLPIPGGAAAVWSGSF